MKEGDGMNEVLPNELLHLIFLQLDFEAVSQVTCVCTRWQAIVNSSGELWKKLLRDIDPTHPIPDCVTEVR